MKVPTTFLTIVFAGVALTIPVYGTTFAADRIGPKRKREPLQ